MSAAGDHVRVFLCDDVAEIRVLMRFTVEEDERLRVVGEAADGEAGVAGVVVLSGFSVGRTPLARDVRPAPEV